MRRMDMSLPHPAKMGAIEPSRVPDYSNNTYEVYFPEKIICIKNSNSIFEPALMEICPITSRVMYMQQFYPIAWYICIDDGVQEAFMRYVMERDMLNAQDRQEKV